MELFAQKTASEQTLRGYQTHGIKQIFSGFKEGKKSALFILPTGGGKTRVMAEITKLAISRGKKVLEISHRDFLVDQFGDSIEKLGHDYGILQSCFPEEFHKNIQVATIQTFTRRHEKIALSWKPDLVLFDEVHHVQSKTQLAVFQRFKDAECWIIGVTATPIRMDGKSIHQLFDQVIEPTNVKTLIEKGFLVPSRVINKYKVDTSHCRKLGGDFRADDLETATNTISSNAHVLEEYQRVCMGKQFIGFAVSVQHSKDLCALFNLNGIPCVHIDGTTKKKEREELLTRFKEKKALGLFNCEIATEGFDCPETEVIIMDRPTSSLPLYLQMGGRGMRSAPGKTECVILDFTENTLKFGKLDLNRHWDVETENKVKKDDEDARLKVCPQCYQLVISHKKFCPSCNHEFVSKPRSSPDEVDGKMDEFEEQVFSREILELVAKVKGYKQGWVYHVLNEQAKGYRVNSKFFLREYREQEFRKIYSESNLIVPLPEKSSGLAE